MKLVLQLSVVLVGGMLALGFLSGCATSLMSRGPVERSVILPASHADAYTHATQTFTRMGGQLQVVDAQNGVFAGIVHGAVALTVRVDPQSMVHVTAMLVPGKVVMGSLTEADDYLALLTQEVPHAR